MNDTKTRLTTDNPKNNVETMLNFAFAKDGYVHLRYDWNDGDGSIELSKFIEKYAPKMGCRTNAAEVMEGGCMDCDCPLAYLNIVATQAAELRERLKAYEDRESKKENKQAGLVVRFTEDQKDEIVNRCLASVEYKINKIRSEAIETFITKLKAKYSEDLNGNDSFVYILLEYIDDIAKEVEGELSHEQ